MLPLRHMFLASLLSWWYGLGWAKLVQKVMGRVHGVLEFFSVGLLFGSLFAPFRQISAGRVGGGTVQDQLIAFGDKLFSRFFGAVIRLLLIIIGLASAVVIAVFGGIFIISWPVLPVLPIIGVLLMQVGVG